MQVHGGNISPILADRPQFGYNECISSLIRNTNPHLFTRSMKLFSVLRVYISEPAIF